MSTTTVRRTLAATFAALTLAAFTPATAGASVDPGDSIPAPEETVTTTAPTAGEQPATTVRPPRVTASASASCTGLAITTSAPAEVWLLIDGFQQPAFPLDGSTFISWTSDAAHTWTVVVPSIGYSNGGTTTPCTSSSTTPATTVAQPDSPAHCPAGEELVPAATGGYQCAPSTTAAPVPCAPPSPACSDAPPVESTPETTARAASAVATPSSPPSTPSAPAAGPMTLPATGSSSWLLVAIAAGLLVAGGGAAFAARRPRG